MSATSDAQPGGLWHTPRYKALSFSWIGETGFGGAMRSTSVAGSIRRHTMLNTMPMIQTQTTPQNAPYLRSGMAGGGIMDILKSALSMGKSFLKGAIPFAIRGSSFGTPGSYLTS